MKLYDGLEGDPRDRAEARFTLAQVLWTERSQRPRALELAKAARLDLYPSALESLRRLARSATRRLIPGQRIPGAGRGVHPSTQNHSINRGPRLAASGRMLRDLPFALRALLKRPGLAVVAILTLGLAIGANTAIFTVVNAVLLRPLPYPAPERLVRVHTTLHSIHNERYWLSVPEYGELVRDGKSYESTAAWAVGTATFGEIERPVRVSAAYTTASFAATLGVLPERGRYFSAAEVQPPRQDPKVTVISHELWQRAFGGDPDIVGRKVSLDSVPVTVIGVMPPGFDFPAADVEAWVPLGVDIGDLGRARASHFLNVAGRLRPGVSVPEAQAELRSLTATWSRLESPEWHAVDAAEHPMTVHPLREEIVAAARAPLWLLQAAVLFVLLIACANVSNLLLARAEERGREIAVRVALGASRARLVRLFFSESLLIGLGAAGLGILVAVWGVDLTAGLLPQGAPRAGEIAVDVRVLGFALACAFAAVVIFGLTPLGHTGAIDLGARLKDGARGSAGRSPLRRALVIAEVALAVVLVIGCGIAVRSFVRLSRVDVGFQPEGLLTFELELAPPRYRDTATAQAFWRRLTGELGQLPGVTGVTYATALPPSQPLTTNVVWFEGAPHYSAKGAPIVDFWSIVGEGYFETLGLRVVAGRGLRPDDRAAVVVNQALARKFFPGKDPVGMAIHLAPWRFDQAPKQTIVGVVADVKQQGLDAPSGTEAFLNAAFLPELVGGYPPIMSVVMRAASPAALTPTVEATVRAIDPSLPLSKVRTMDRLLWEAVAKPRFLTFVMGIFGGLALLLAVIGVYSVMSMAVAQRTREIGIRMALGARAGGVQRLVLRQGMLLVVVGIFAGVLGALGLNAALAGVLGRVLYHTPALDPATFAAVGGLVGAVAALACWVPARRATRVDPMIALRAE